MFSKISFPLLTLLIFFFFLYLSENATNQIIFPLRNSISEQSLNKLLVDDYWHYHYIGNLRLIVTNYGLFGQGYSAKNEDSGYTHAGNLLIINML
jgi:hypothetical protein